MISIYKDHLKNFPFLSYFLDEVYVCTISILIILKREKDALKLIDVAQKICNSFQMNQCRAKLQLINLSLQIRNKNIFEIQNKLFDID